MTISTSNEGEIAARKKGLFLFCVLNMFRQVNSNQLCLSNVSILHCTSASTPPCLCSLVVSLYLAASRNFPFLNCTATDIANKMDRKDMK